MKKVSRRVVSVLLKPLTKTAMPTDFFITLAGNMVSMYLSVLFWQHSWINGEQYYHFSEVSLYFTQGDT
jgi:hypothetical protein